MSEHKTLTCIGCPMGCELSIELENNEIKTITGYSCKIGIEYAKKEISNPTRIVTTVLPVINGKELMVSVKTSKDIPKNMISSCMKELKGYHVEAPIAIGDVLLKGICGSDVDIIATKEVLKK